MVVVVGSEWKPTFTSSTASDGQLALPGFATVSLYSCRGGGRLEFGFLLQR